MVTIHSETNGLTFVRGKTVKVKESFKTPVRDIPEQPGSALKAQTNENRRQHLIRKLERGMVYDLNRALREARINSERGGEPTGAIRVWVRYGANGVWAVPAAWFEQWVTNELERRRIAAVVYSTFGDPIPTNFDGGFQFFGRVLIRLQ